MFAQLDDTIVAISSPSGAGVRGVIRLSGPNAFPLAESVFTSHRGKMDAHQRLIGEVRIDDAGAVPAEMYTFRAPASYTRQDIVEIHTIGSPPVLASVLEHLTAAGARLAEAGEFTARAYFNGAMDLTRVEGVAAIIQARNDSQLRASQALLHGGLSRRSTELRDRLADLLALIEAQIDFVEESIEFITRGQVTGTVAAVLCDLESLLRNSPAVERLEVLPEVTLVGRPNAGKSTLFNQLTGMDRAIRSATAGTTRDVLRAPLMLPGGEVMLSDSAGLESAAESDIAGLAQAATRRSMASADLILLLIDITDQPAKTLAQMRPALPKSPIRVVANKTDAMTPDAVKSTITSIGAGELILPISALTGEGLGALREEIGRSLFGETESHGAELLAITNRQRAALMDAAQALQRACDILDDTDQWAVRAELLAIEVREAMHALSLLTGEITTDDLLGRIFSRFCIGK